MRRGPRPDELVTIYEAPHGHRLPEADHEPVTWRYKDGCTVTVNDDGSHTFTPFYEAASAPVTRDLGE